MIDFVIPTENFIIYSSAVTVNSIEDKRIHDRSHVNVYIVVKNFVKKLKMGNEQEQEHTPKNTRKLSQLCE